jgi:hypothetical protein
MACQNTGVEPENSAARPQIVGGTEATPGAYPFMAEVRVGNGLCGGSLIDSQWVLTAAHCLEDTNLTNYTVTLGQHNRNISEVSKQVFGVTAIVRHPNFNPKTYSNDVGLLKLSSQAVINNRVVTISIGDVNNITVGTLLRSIGWGHTSEGGNVSSTLQQVDLPRIAQQNCTDVMGTNRIDDTMFCAGPISGGRDTCQGDSGGPLFDPNTSRQIGVVSWGIGCARSSTYGVYTNLGRYTRWIASYTRSFSGELSAAAGGAWGTWGVSQFCVPGEFAYGLRTRIESAQGRGDDTALNTIQLLCRPETSSSTPETEIISSKEGFWGDWSSWSKCATGEILASYELKVEGGQGGGDDTAANAVRMGCRSIRSSVATPSYTLLPAQQQWGSWTGYRQTPVGKAICGIQTKVEDQQGGNNDDTALNDVKFFYCDLATPADPPPPVTYQLNVTFSGTGVVASSAIQCGNNVPNCTATLPQGYSETLNVSSGTVLSWSGCDSSTATTCTFTMNADRQIRVAFR